jgi:hypothetical protein
LKLYIIKKYNEFKRIFTDASKTYFSTSFSYPGFLKRTEKALAALGIFGAIIAYLNTLVTTSTFNGFLTNQYNAQINKTTINATIAAQTVSPPDNHIFTFLINMGISTTILLFISISLYIIWEAITYKGITYISHRRIRIHQKRTYKTQKIIKINSISLNIIEIQYLYDIFKRSSFIFLFSVLVSIFIFYLLIGYPTYLWIMILLLISIGLLLLFLIGFRIILRTIPKTDKFQKLVFILFLFPVFWICLAPFVLITSLILNAIYPSLQYIIVKLFNTYFTGGVYVLYFVLIIVVLYLVKALVDQAWLNFKKARLLKLKRPRTGLFISGATGCILGFTLLMILWAVYNFIINILHINKSIFMINWTVIIVVGTLLFTILGINAYRKEG